MTLKKLIFNLFILAICCVTTAGAVTLSDLTNKKWELVTFNGQKIDSELYPQEKPNIQFTDVLRYNAWAGCNRIAGNYTFTPESTLQFAPNSIMTKMACFGAQNIEDAFVTMLPAVQTVTIQESNMQFLDKQNNVVAEFKLSN